MADRYASLKQGLVGAWIPSISGSGLLLPDLSGRNNNGSLVNMDASDWVSSGSGRALDFDGTLDHVDLGANHNLTGAFSFSIWANLRSKTGYKLILAKSDFGSSPNKREFLFYVSGTDLTPHDSLAFVIMNPTSFANRIGRSLPNESIPLNQFTNFICTYTGNGANSGIAIYINGVRSDTTDQGVGTFTGVVTQTTPLAIGTDFNNFPTLGNQANMISDDIRIYNRALTDSEIRLLASEPGIGFKRRASSVFAKRYTYQPPKAKVFEGVRVRDHDYSSLRQGLVGAWCPSLPNGGSGNLLVDQSQRGNHGTLTNMSAGAWVSGQYGRALDFANGSDYVAISNTSLTGTFSASMWFSRRTIGGGDGNCLLGNTGSGNTLLPYVQASNYLIRTDGSASQSYAFPTLAAINHIVVTRDQSNNVKVFTNGIESTSGAKSISGTFTINMIGRYQVQNYGLDGIMDDIRIYNRALTEPEIRLLASRPGIGLQPSPTRFIAREKQTGLRRKILTGQT